MVDPAPHLLIPPEIGARGDALIGALCHVATSTHRDLTAQLVGWAETYAMHGDPRLLEWLERELGRPQHG